MQQNILLNMIFTHLILKLKKNGTLNREIFTSPLRANYNKIPAICKKRFEQQILSECNAICYCFQQEKPPTSQILKLAKQNNLALFPITLEQIR